LPESAASREIAARVFRPDLYRLHVGDAAPARVPQPFDDDRFDPADVASYLERVPIYTPFISATRVDG